MSESDRDLPRREFVKGLSIIAPAAALFGSNEARADDEKPKPPTETHARMEIILARFGNELDESARKSIARDVEALTRRAEALRKFPLENGDGPFPIFHPYRGPSS